MRRLLFQGHIYHAMQKAPSTKIRLIGFKRSMMRLLFCAHLLFQCAYILMLILLAIAASKVYIVDEGRASP